MDTERWRPATSADLPHLAQMNRRLIADEGSENPMSLGELWERMAGWLDGEYAVDVLGENDAVLGYAVWQQRGDEYQPARQRVYVRQFFIERALRSRGLGRRAFERLRRERFPAGCLVSLDVLATNAHAARFWHSLGFTEYYLNLRMRND